MIIVYLDVMGPSLDPQIALGTQWSDDVSRHNRRRFRDHLLSTDFADIAQLVILRVNPGDRSDSMSVFRSLAASFIDHLDPVGRDIGAILGAARQLPPDEFILFVGSTCYPVAPDWASRLFNAWTEYSPGAVAPFASLEVFPHLRTACFGTQPRLLLEYPFEQLCSHDFYRFEHSSFNYSLWLESRGFTPLQVTRQTVLPFRQCRNVRNGYRRGNQSELLVRDRHCDVYANASWYERINMRKCASGGQAFSLERPLLHFKSRLKSLLQGLHRR